MISAVSSLASERETDRGEIPAASPRTVLPPQQTAELHAPHVPASKIARRTSLSTALTTLRSSPASNSLRALSDSRVAGVPRGAAREDVTGRTATCGISLVIGSTL